MNDSDEIINQLTLKYFMNNHKKIRQKENEKDKASKKDQKFYRKRIVNLTKDLLYEVDVPVDVPVDSNNKIEEIPTSITSDVNYAFNHYIKTCI